MILINLWGIWWRRCGEIFYYCITLEKYVMFPMEKMRQNVYFCINLKKHMLRRHMPYLWIIWLNSGSPGCVSTKGFGLQIIIAARSSKRFIISNLLALEKLPEYRPLILRAGYQTKPNVNCCCNLEISTRQ